MAKARYTVRMARQGIWVFNQDIGKGPTNSRSGHVLRIEGERYRIVGGGCAGAKHRSGMVRVTGDTTDLVVSRCGIVLARHKDA